MKTKEEMFLAISYVICRKPEELDAESCFEKYGKYNPVCKRHKKCRIWEKSDEQLDYIDNNHIENCFLKACAGSGKTEVVGMNSACKIQQWNSCIKGVGVLSFTNTAANVIMERVSEFTRGQGLRYPHYIGTFDSWLHRYIANPFVHLVTGYLGKDGDHSVRVIEESSQAGFLNAFITDNNFNKMGKVKANEIFIDMANKRFVITRNKKKYFPELSKQKKNDLMRTKKKFWEAGFATYSDVEYLCFKLLEKSPNTAEIISLRFPLLIIDECQDLSPLQLMILQKLLDNGTNYSFIGDLNQAIYSFREVYPEKVQIFTQSNNFSEQKLTQNFRSLQNIVDLTSKLIAEETRIKGRINSDKLPSCLYTTYEKTKIYDLSGKFIAYLKQREIDPAESLILARNNNTVAKLRPGVVNNISAKMLPAIAIQIWKIPNISCEQMEEALTCVGEFVSTRYFLGPSSNRQSYYCPINVESNITWRLLLSRLLDKCCNNQNLSLLEQPWKDWSKSFRESFFDILSECVSEINGSLSKYLDNNAPKYTAPKETSEKKVSTTLQTSKGNPSLIRITNFHKVKGITVDAAMVVSSPTAQGGGGGFWRTWLQDPKSENARFAYVASTRPRNLLVWAVPNPMKPEDHDMLLKLGFEYSGLS